MYKLAVEWRIAFPPHPEFRTLPMVWYVPPHSPIMRGHEELKRISDEIDSMRIPVRYLANLLTAGDEAPVRQGLAKLIAVRRYMRSMRVEKKPDRGALRKPG